MAVITITVDRLEKVMTITINPKTPDPQADPQTMTQMVETVAQICPQDLAEIQIQITEMEITEMTTIQIQTIPSVIW